MTDTHDAIRLHSQELADLLVAYDDERNLTSLQLKEIVWHEQERIRLNAEIDRLNALPTTPPPPPLLGNLPGWRLIFHDDFKGNSTWLDPTKWASYPSTYRDTSKNGVYTPSNAYLIEGALRIWLYTDAANVPRVCAPVPLILGPDKSTWGNQNLTWPDQLYGRYSVRARVPAPLPGYKLAWLTWPDQGTNTSGAAGGVGGNGEIDFPECGLDTSVVRVGGYMHRQNATVGGDQYACGITLDLREWHTYVTEWAPGRCSFLVDGVVVGSTETRVPNTPMHHVLQCETRLSGGMPPATTNGYVEIAEYAAWARA